MATRLTTKRIRTLARRSLRWSIAIAPIFMATSSTAFGQLRTGRQTDRDFYTAESTSTRTSAKAKSAASSDDEGVVTASAVMPQEATVVSKPKRSSSSVHKPNTAVAKSASIKKDRNVVQASCPNCAAGIPHHHGAAPIAQDSIVEEADGEVVDSGLHSDIYDSDAYQIGGGPNCQCGPYDPCTGTAGYRMVAVPTFGLGGLLNRIQLRVEAATFYGTSESLPALITTRRPANAVETDGVVGRSDTINLFGGSNVLGGGTQGLRGEGGFYFDRAQRNGFLGRFFDAGDKGLIYQSSSSEPVVMRPYFDVTQNENSTIPVNYPNVTSGSIDAKITTGVYGGDLLFRHVVARGCAGKLEWLAGYQTARLSERLSLSSATTAQPNVAIPPGTVTELQDNFATNSRFNGFALGLAGSTQDRCWRLSGMFKLGMGNMERYVDINGSTRITTPGNPTTVNASAEGLLARGTNSGQYLSNTFVVVPEVNATLSYRLTHRLEANIGYSFLELPKTARVANQIDTASNLSNPPSGDARPRFSLLESNYMLHSINYGLQYRY